MEWREKKEPGKVAGFALHRFGPAQEMEALVVQDHELGAVGAAGQRGAQVTDDEVPLLCGSEDDGGELGGRKECCKWLVLCCHCPEGQVVFGVFIQEPGIWKGGAASATPAHPNPLPNPPQASVVLKHPSPGERYLMK